MAQVIGDYHVNMVLQKILPPKMIVLVLAAKQNP